MFGDRNGLAEVSGVDEDDDDDKVGDGNAIGKNVEDGSDEGMGISTAGSSIITSKLSKMFSTSRAVSLACDPDF